MSAEKINIDSWNRDSALYDVLDNTAESNSAVEYAFLRVKYDRPSNRIRLLFMLELSSFTDESNAGVTLSVNGDEEITLHLNGTAEYNEDKYYAEINHLSYPITNTLYLEVTLGIKKGIPDEVQLEFNVYDTEGVPSNTYCVDITEYPTDLTEENPKADTQENESESKTEKTKRTKTTKAKTTKARTTKKTKSQKTDNSEQALTDDGEDTSQTVIESDSTGSVAENVTVVSKNKIIAIIIAAAVVACGAATGITNLLKKTRTRDGG